LWSKVSARPESKNDCAGKCQQQFNRPTDRPVESEHRVQGQSPGGKDVNREAEESMELRVVTKQRLVETQQTEKT
jgi:hypothetical protein